ncbi:molybdopterin cofactor-binding domain-containing protein [Sphingomonas hankyongi]|uniref:Molybdopterin-dependent oxidoreductase n=1 Tax=Sphingomonas hankyongi TaxID=2908209 RepID=A0ABT0S2N0_9SPHN|nr:molybdopterin cofactor-binding domain-containing protein [Sphingomonas hankyongi]MCL6730001.1 molybdopterin-dependent oxidoreductase [Sphingomonas hankyongi]
MSIDRRTVLIGGGVGIGLVVAFATWPRTLSSDLAVEQGEQAFGNFIKIARTGKITVAVPQAETGQGIWTALSQIVADELGATWEMVGVEPAPLSGDYGNPLAKGEGWLDGLGVLRSHIVEREGLTRITGGSTSVRAFEQPMREAAAVARTMLVGAAADRWNVDPTECEAADGFIVSATQTIGFGDVAEEAARRAPPRSATRRQTKRPRLFGGPLKRIDGPAKANGSLRFASDVRLPGLLYASARLAPPGSELRGFDRNAAASAPDVRHVAATSQWIAVVADSWSRAERALKQADPVFSGAQTAVPLRDLFADALGSGDPHEYFSSGGYDAATRDARALTATYYVGPGQHLGLEPASATARSVNGSIELWAGCQAPDLMRASIAANANLSPKDVILYPLPVGDPAGRAMENEIGSIAVELARRAGRPVQLTLSQSVSQNHDAVSPGAMGRMTALLDQAGLPTAWQMRVATADGFGSALARLTDSELPAQLGRTALDTAVPPYSITNLRVQAIKADLPLRAGYMRGSPQREMCFFTESFIDELAHRAGMEPLAYRMSLLGANGRLARCLQAAARLANWDGGGAGSTMGMAGCAAFGSNIGLVATASIDQAQRIKVHKLIAAVDCGRVVNSAIATQQIEAGLIWALAQATAASPEWVAGMPRSRRMGGVGLPRIADTPEIRVQLIPSSEAPGGISGLGTTVLAPAVANAIHAGTGKRLRDLPFDLMAAA